MTKNIKIEIEVDEQDYTADVDIIYRTEKNWGADADGNRGIEKTVIEDFEPIEVTDSAGKVVDMTADMYCEIHSKVYDVNMEEL